MLSESSVIDECIDTFFNAELDDFHSSRGKTAASGARSAASGHRSGVALPGRCLGRGRPRPEYDERWRHVFEAGGESEV
jgi:hypothetical protein